MNRVIRKNDLNAIKPDRSQLGWLCKCLPIRCASSSGLCCGAEWAGYAGVSTGGIGERAEETRANICSGLEYLGVALDMDTNGRNAEVIAGLEVFQRKWVSSAAPMFI